MEVHSIDIAVMVLHTILIILPGFTFEHAVSSKVSANRCVSEWNTHRTGAEEVLLMIDPEAYPASNCWQHVVTRQAPQLQQWLTCAADILGNLKAYPKAKAPS